MSHNEKFNKYNDKILAKMIEKFGSRIDELDSVTAMIEYKFKNQT